MITMELKDRYVAAMVLGGVGDALGYKNGDWESCTSGEQIHKELDNMHGVENIDIKDWKVNDSTVMSIAIAKVLSHNYQDEEMMFSRLAQAYIDSTRALNGRSPSMTCVRACRLLKPQNPKGYIIPFSAVSDGSGAAARAMAIGLRYPGCKDFKDLIKVSIESGRMTHHHPVAYLGALASALFASYAIQMKPLREWGRGLMETLPHALAYVKKRGVDVEANVKYWNIFSDKWKEYLSIRNISDGRTEPVFPTNFGVKERDEFYENLSSDGCGGASGYDAPMIAYDALLGYNGTWPDLCSRSMFHGGDSDGTGHIAAFCYGAMKGLAEVPPNNYEHLEFRERLEHLAVQLHGLCYSNRSILTREQDIPDDFRNDPRLIRLYKTALEEGKVKDNSLRVMVVGCYSHGKTSLVRRLLKQSVADVESTDGIHIHINKLQLSDDGSMNVFNDTMETQNDKRIASLVSSTYPKHIYSQDVLHSNEVPSRRSSTVNEDQHRVNVQHDKSICLNNELFHAKSPVIEGDITSTNQPDIDTECNADEQKRNNDLFKLKKPEDFRAFESEMRKSNMLYVTNTSVEEKSLKLYLWDFAGEFVYYATHHLFHSRKAIYLLVFDLSKGLDTIVKDEQFGDKTIEYFFKFWINSIHSFVGTGEGCEPPIILVGTHKDKFAGDCSVVFDEVRGLFENTPLINHLHSQDFAIDNTDEDDEVVVMLRSVIVKVADERRDKTYIPAKWIQLENALSKIRQSGRKFVRFDDVINEDKESDVPILDTDQIKLFLHYHHEQGQLFYFEDDDLRDFVVLDPQYLIDAFKRIITSKRDRLRSAKFSSRWKKLYEEAILDPVLLDHVWPATFLQNKNDKQLLLRFLEKNSIIAEALKIKDDQITRQAGMHTYYIVTSFLKPDYGANVDAFLNGKHMTKISLCYDFNSSTILPTVFQRITAAAMGKWPIIVFDGCRLLFKNRAVFELPLSHAGIIRVLENVLELVVCKLCSGNINAVACDEFRRCVEMTIRYEFRKFAGCETDTEQPFRMFVRCFHKDHFGKGSKAFHDFSQLSCVKIFHCPDKKNHDMDVPLAKAEWFCDVCLSNNKSYEELQERDLSKIASAIGSNWELLAPELGLDQVSIEHIKSDEKSTVSQIYKMLLVWQQQSVDISLKNLLKKIKLCESVNVNWDKIRNIQDEMLLNQSSKMDKDLVKIANAIGRNWELLGLELGLDQVRIDRIKLEEKTIVLQIYKMLLLWRQRSPNASLENLLTIIKMCESVTVNWDMIKNIENKLSGIE